jgi:hypothetical protein
MSDLKASFIQEYGYCEEISPSAHSSIDTTNDPKCDFILPANVSQHRIHLLYNDETILSDIPESDVIAFYETLHSMTRHNSRILMPCLFQNKMDKKGFGLPIFLSVPRRGGRGQDVRDALHDTLDKFIPPNLNIKQLPYDTYLQSKAYYSLKETKLDDILQDEIDFGRTHATLIVAFDSEFVDAYERHYLGQFGF